MIAYNRTWLENLRIKNACQKAFKEHMPGEEEWKNIADTHPVAFYTPNIFIRCGLFLLTLVIALFTFGLLCLVFLDNIESSIEGLSIFFGLLTYAALEFMVQQKHHLRSGVTEALTWASAGFLFGGFSYLLQPGDLANCVLLCILGAWFSIRFADIVSSLVAFLSFLAALFYGCIHIGEISKGLAPFLLMAASCATYICTRHIDFRKRFMHYAHCMEAVECCSLLALYAAGNYYVIAQINSKLSVQDNGQVSHIPFGWIFWITTCIIPPSYIAIGLIKKNRIMYRVGLLLLVALVFTVNYYFSIAPLEVTLTVAGIILITASWLLIRLLKEAKYGYAYVKQMESYPENIETIAIAETFTAAPEKPGQAEFGGGSFGGAGAGSEF